MALGHKIAGAHVFTRATFLGALCRIDTCIVGGDVDVVGEDSGEHGSVEERGRDHEADDGALVTSGQANADQARGGDQRS